MYINKPRAAGFYKVLFLESRSSELARSELWLPCINLSSAVETESLDQTAGNSMGLETESDDLVVDCDVLLGRALGGTDTGRGDEVAGGILGEHARQVDRLGEFGKI